MLEQELFGIENLPYGVFSDKNSDNKRLGVAFEDKVLDLSVLERDNLINIKDANNVFARDSLNYFASLGYATWSEVRKKIQDLLQNHRHLLLDALISREKIKMWPPFAVGGFTDFYAGEQHATNVGKLFRPNDPPLLPNWKRLPVAYNGRASTVFISGHTIKRPKGQIQLSPGAAPIFSSTKKLDFELELGFFVGVGNPDAQPITVDKAYEHIFGVVLLNDWSARDIQAFEYQPLGPFLGKSFATSISPWVVPLDALKPFMQSLPVQDPKPVDYLAQKEPTMPAINLRVELQPSGTAEKFTLCETSSTNLYWSMEQMLAHHSVNNCIMQTGDLLGTGTISGTTVKSWGSLLELAFNGKTPLKFSENLERSFLENGDKVIITGYCETNNISISLGAVEGTIENNSDI